MKLNRLVYALLLALIVHGFSLAQEREVKGTVRDSNGLEMLGVAVVVKGEGHGTETNLDGKYTIRVADGKTLEFSFLGMKTKRFKVNGQGRIDVVMEEEAQAIDEVVVMGYGSGRKVGTVVGSVTHIGGKEIANRPSSSAVDALQGKVPGLQILSSSGEPSSLASIRLYGVGSLGSSSSRPLFVVDGIPITDAAVRSLNQADFESISVLKDASATSIYGSRASNGVVYITTKRGKNNTKGEITVHTQYGLSNLADRSAFERLMNADELAKFWVGADLKTQAQMDKIRRENPYDTRWDKVYFQEDIPLMQTDISVAGGSEKSRYYVSGGYYNQKGVMYRSGFERYNLRSNVDSRVNDWLKLGMNMSLTYYEAQTNQYTGANLNGGLSMLFAPFYSPVDKNGNRLDFIPGIGAYHPNYLAEKAPSKGAGVELIPTGFIEITPIKGLTFKTQGGIQYRDVIGEANRLPSYQGAYLKGTVSKEYSKVLQKTLTNSLEYRFTLNKVNNFSALLGQEVVSLFTHSFSASGEGLIDDSLLLLSHATSNKDVGESKSKSTMNSLFGRVEYDYNSKYFLDFSLRRDGSSKFSPNHKYGNFWAAGAMWRISKEAFLAKSNLVNDLSLKLSVGTSGNSDIGSYTHQALASASQYEGATSWAISAAGNPDLTWEKQTKYTFTVDGCFFNSRLNTNVELYRRITTDMLMDVPVPYTTSFETIKRNVGKLQNQGVSFTISGDVYKNKAHDITVTPYVNFGYNQDKVLELFQGRKSWYLPDDLVGYVEGQPVKFFLPIFKGINPQNGDAQWYKPLEDNAVTNKDPNDVYNDFTDSAVQNTGVNRYAPYNGGFGLTANYKSLSLQVDFAFSKGKYLINNDRYFIENPVKFSSFNQSRSVNDYWKQPGDVTTFPRLGVQFTQFDTRLLEDASFMRLKNLTVAYSLPQEAIKQVGFFNAVRFYVTGRNLLTWTKYLGQDPEIDSNLTYGSYPNTKQYVFGVELKF
jgi:hypothetical protein